MCIFIMSVVVQNTHGWVVDSRSLIDQSHSPCVRWKGNQEAHVKYCLKSQCFQIRKSHFSVNPSADAKAEDTDKWQDFDTSSKPTKFHPGHTCVKESVDDTYKDTRHPDSYPDQTKQLERRKRKRGDLNQGEIDSKVFHKKVRDFIKEGTKALVDSARSAQYLGPSEEAALGPVPSQECGLSALCEMAKELPLVDEEEQEACVQTLDARCASHLDLFSRLTENRSETATVVTLMGEEYVIPPRTAFLLSDFTRIQPLVRYGKKFDLIVVDPPWENKSVKRSRRYSFLPSSQLKQLPVPVLASSTCFVVTWVTNRQSHLRFVRDELYPHWGVRVVAQWFWVKVTTSGQFVFPLDSEHKKPYEVLVLGRYGSSASSSDSPVEGQRLIVSVPSALHSQKPSLSEVLKPYVGPEAKCLELFARNLQPGWTSWGNEVLKFQHTSYFTLSPADDGARVPEDEATDHGAAFNSPGKIQSH